MKTHKDFLLSAAGGCPHTTVAKPERKLLQDLHFSLIYSFEIGQEQDTKIATFQA